MHIVRALRFGEGPSGVIGASVEAYYLSVVLILHDERRIIVEFEESCTVLFVGKFLYGVVF